MFTFRAMNTEVSVIAAGDEERAATRAADLFARAEARFSRFRGDSELSALNRARGPLRVSPDLFAALLRARGYLELTGGLFDPAIGGALAALGYDRSFAPGALDRATAPAPAPAASLLEVALDLANRTVERPDHVQIDLGGMIKGAAVDAAARACLGGAGAIDAGGDAAVRGCAPDGEPWRIEIEDPRDASRVIATVAACDRAVATSASNRRRWQLGSGQAHHIIDPRTGEPAASDLAQVTVLAPRAELAEVVAKAVLLLGERAGRRFLEAQPGAGAVLVQRDGGLSYAGEVAVREVRHG
jgi:thiamine biosynthesis lipoprotein